MDTESNVNIYGRFSLQNEDYHSYCVVQVPAQQYYPTLTPEE